MIKNIIKLVIASSVISAGLLYVGTTMIGYFSPALASSMNALVVGANTQNASKGVPVESSVRVTAGQGIVNDLPAIIPANDRAAITVNLSGGEGKPEVSSPPTNSTSKETLGASITIAELLKNPSQYLHQIFNITGIANDLGSDKFLLNDGTGQILVEAEEDLAGLAILTNGYITVMGKLDDSSSQASLEFDACTLTNQSGSISLDDCVGDDTEDDSEGDIDDDTDAADDDPEDEVDDEDDPDDSDDNPDDVDEDPDDVENDPEDDADDDAEDDTEDDSSDDAGDDAEDDSGEESDD